MLVIEQPDGTMALVPEWMTTPAAAAAEIRKSPRIPLSELRALRQFADVALSLLSDGGNGGWHEVLRSPRAAGLVSRTAPKTSLPPAVISRLVLLFEEMLAQAATFELAVRKRVDEQQDHA